MREGQFIQQNIEKWKGYQSTPVTDPDELARRFTDLVEDLGYAKTFYPQSRVTAYLNSLSSGIYLGIYKNKKEESSRIFRFWKSELPVIMFRYRRELFYALTLFIFFCVIAAFSAGHDEHFVRGVLGDSYVEMTEENIAKGDPFGVYKSDDPMNMFLTIALNNIRISFMIFITGILACVGTIWFLFTNGMMLGSFQYYFFTKGLGMKSILVIWIHGTLEISSIIIAGGAGIVLGRSLLFPGSDTRISSLKRGARDGLKMMIGLVPVFLAAAFLEGFVTRFSNMPVWLSVSILAGSLTFIIWYFAVYPVRVAKRLPPLL